MENNKQTAVDWLLSQINGYSYGIGLPHDMNVRIDIPKEIIEQAKAIEKEQMEDAFEAGEDSKEEEINGDGETSFEEYYNETYKQAY